MWKTEMLQAWLGNNSVFEGEITLASHLHDYSGSVYDGSHGWMDRTVALTIVSHGLGQILHYNCSNDVICALRICVVY